MTERRQAGIRLAACGDLHVDERAFPHLERDVAALDGVDLLLVAGDLTTTGEVDQARLLAALLRDVDVPIVAVLGNHDWEGGQGASIAGVLEEAGMHVLDRSCVRLDVRGLEVGVAGGKGFIGGFDDSRLPRFGEPLLKRIYDETVAEAEGLDRGLEGIAGCDLRIGLLHYAPVSATVEGERPAIWPFLGSSLLAGPILAHAPDLVFHGHAHHGALVGRAGTVPVYNVASPVIGRSFWIADVAPGPDRVTLLPPPVSSPSLQGTPGP